MSDPAPPPAAPIISVAVASSAKRASEQLGFLKEAAEKMENAPPTAAPADRDEEVARISAALKEVLAEYRLVFASRDDVDTSVAERDALKAERDAARAENATLRASTANGPGPCLYCNLPREEWSKCAEGFPGCPRSDDAMLCPHVGAELETTDKLTAAEARIRQLEAEVAGLTAAADRYYFGSQGS